MDTFIFKWKVQTKQHQVCYLVLFFPFLGLNFSFKNIGVSLSPFLPKKINLKIFLFLKEKFSPMQFIAFYTHGRKNATSRSTAQEWPLLSIQLFFHEENSLWNKPTPDIETCMTSEQSMTQRGHHWNCPYLHRSGETEGWGRVPQEHIQGHP